MLNKLDVDVKRILIITALWLGMIITVNPVGDFPLNDDWAYARAAKLIVQEGRFSLEGANTSANLLAQAVWGAIFCIPFGFSFTALRLSTLVLGLLGILATYIILREIKVHHQIAFLSSLLIALNPIYFGLSNTFMTDIPFFAVCLWAILFLVVGLKRNSYRHIAFGIFLSYITLLIRQNGIIILFVFGCAYLVKKGMNKRNCIIGISPFLLGIIIQFIYAKWLESTGRSSPNFNLQLKYLEDILLSGEIKYIVINLVSYTLQGLAFLGLLMFPILFLFFLEDIKKISPKKKYIYIYILAPCFILFLGWFIRKGIKLPLARLGNILTYFGLGPLTLHDSFILRSNLPEETTILNTIWIFLTIIGIGGGVFIIYFLIKEIIQIVNETMRIKSLKSKWLILFFIIAICVYYLPMGVQGFFDRYLLLLIPLLLIFMLVSVTDVSRGENELQMNKGKISFIVVSLLIYGAFTIAATHDYLSWNRTRWEALNYLLKDCDASPATIDGGFEFNCWYLYDPNDIDSIRWRQKPGSKRSWWFVVQDDYMITFGGVPGYRKLKNYALNQWLPIGPKNLYILSKDK